MKLIINEEYNLICEAFGFFYNLQNNEDPREIKKSILEKYEIKSDVVTWKMDKIIKVTDYLMEHIEVDKEKLAFYFKDLNQGRCTLADFVLLKKNLLIEEDLIERADLIRKMSDQERLTDFACVLDGMISEDDRSDSIRQIDNFQELLRVLDTSEVSAEDKWNIQRVYLNQNKYLEELIGMIQNLVVHFKKWEKDMDELKTITRNCFLRFNNFKEISEYVNISMGDLVNAETLILQPSFFNMYTISISSRNVDGCCQMIMGCLFDDDFNVAKATENNAGVYSKLKILSDKSKFDILLFLRDRSAYGLELSKQFNLTTPTISHHMSALISVGFVVIEKRQNRLYYKADREHLEEFLDSVKKVLIGR
jgi:DNA-binding transcriptional ArsR family regulator